MHKQDSSTLLKRPKTSNVLSKPTSQRGKQEGGENSHRESSMNDTNNQYRNRPILYPIKSGNFDILYSEEGDGEILVEMQEAQGNLRLITCVDISTLYKEKRNKAIEIAKEFFKLQHPNLLCMTEDFELLDNNGTLLFYTESPDHIAGWKSYCKKKFTTEEMLCIFRQLCEGLAYVHEKGMIHRDVHPTRIHTTYGLAKFNLIGMPYNYKKLLKKDNFCGHVNYSAPELIQEKVEFSPKVDIWSLGCCLYYLCTKKDPFEGRSPQEIKQNIMLGRLERYPTKLDPILKSLINKCLEKDEYKRLTAQEMLEFQDNLEISVYGEIRSTPIIEKILERYHQLMTNPNEGTQNEAVTGQLNNNRYKNPQFFINSRYSQQQENDETQEKSPRDYSYNQVQQSNNRNYYRNMQYQDTDSYQNTQAQFHQNYKQYRQQQYIQNGDKTSIGTYTRQSVKQNFQNNMDQYYKKQQQHQQYNKMNHTYNEQPKNPYNVQQTYGPQITKQDNQQQPEVFSLPCTKDSQTCIQSQRSQGNDLNQQNPHYHFNLTERNLDKFNSQYDNLTASADMKTSLITSISEDKLKPESKIANKSREDEFKNMEGKIENPANNSTDCIVQCNDGQMPYSIFNKECIFLEKFDSNSSDDNEFESDMLKDTIIQEDPSSNESRNEMNKEEIEGIVASIVETSKRVKSNSNLLKSIDQLHYQDGTKYVGEVMRHGMGIFYEQDGSIYDGQWFEDQKHGRGKMLFPDGSVYDGQWDCDKMHGQGVYLTCNGDRYEGNFHYGLKNGNGTIHYKNGNTYSGEWKNDTLWGQGTFVFKNGNQYQGMLVNGLFDGQGTMLFAGIGIYRGSFSGGNLDGIGKLEYLNGSSYEGSWKENKKHGNGKFIDQDGVSIYSGEWENDLKHGKGSFLQNGTCIIEGVWNKGNLVEMTQFQNYK